MIILIIIKEKILKMTRKFLKNFIYFQLKINSLTAKLLKYESYFNGIFTPLVYGYFFSMMAANELKKMNFNNFIK